MQKILAIIPARGGSQGIPLKNLRSVGGKSLIAITAEICHQLKLVTHAVVSTDHQGIKKEAEDCGLLVPFMRPDYLSGSRVGDLDVLIHATREMEKEYDLIYDYILMLQPTCPLRKAEHVNSCIKMMISDPSLESVWTVSPCDLKYHPLKQLAFMGTNLGLMDPEGAKILARQQLEPTYIRNGACYIWKRDILVDEKKFLPEKTQPFIIPSSELVNIDTFEDLELAERIYREAS